MRISFQNRLPVTVHKVAFLRQHAGESPSARKIFSYGQWQRQYFSNLKALVATFSETVGADAQAADLKPLAEMLQRDPNIFRAFWVLGRPLRPSPLSTLEDYLKYYHGIAPHYHHQAIRPNAERVLTAIFAAHEFLQKEGSKGSSKPTLQTLFDIAGFDVGYHQGFSALVFLKALKATTASQRSAVLSTLKHYSRPQPVQYPPVAPPLQMVSAFPHQRIYPASQNLVQVFYDLAVEKNNAVAIALANALKAQDGNPYKLKFLGLVAPSFHVVNFIKNFVREHVPQMYSKPRLAKRKSLPSVAQFVSAFQATYDWIKANHAGRTPDIDMWFNMACFELGFNDVMTLSAFGNYLAQLSDAEGETFFKNLEHYPPRA